MKKCNSCGSLYPDEGRFCPECGGKASDTLDACPLRLSPVRPDSGKALPGMPPEGAWAEALIT